MNKYRRLVCCIFIVEILLLIAFNWVYLSNHKNDGDRLYRVEAARIVRELEKYDLNTVDLSQYHTIVNVSEFDADEHCNNDYLVEAAGGKLYRIEYRLTDNYQELFRFNALIIMIIIVTGIAFIYVQKKVMRPFHNISNLSYELAKGNLTVPIKEEKSKFFGRFLWGMDMLREKLEDDKEKELSLQRDKKTLILSLSHDIKTPLSSIELYTKALSENLYDTDDKKTEAFRGIAKNVQEIKQYVNEIVEASREDFLNLEVVNDEFYLSEVIKLTEVYYRDKLSVVHTELIIDKIEDCLVKGDKNRLTEVMQNIMENAIKYGSGEWIKISFDEEEDCRLIHIENPGCTLKKEELPNIYDSFYRGSNSQGIKGNGLGLYICRNLMRKMDGEIYVQIHDDCFVATVVIHKA